MIEVSNISQLKSLLEENKDRTFFLLKHSTRCATSAMAFAELERFSGKQANVVCAFVKVIENRDLSNEIAQMTGITHHSPQIFLFSKGELLWNASHSDIREETLLEHLPARS